MLTRWCIEESPTKSDPLRRILSVRAAQSDIQRLIRTLGAACGRPKREKNGGDFNFTIILHSLSGPALKNVEDELKALCTSSVAVKPRDDFKPAPSPPPVGPTEEMISLSAEEPKAEEPPASVMEVRRKDSPPTAAWTPALKALSESRLCGLSLALDPAKIFENFSVGPYNRFAHAAAMSVIANPGAMYNPLFISGNRGTGKTHLLEAVGHKLQASPDEPAILTSGVSLALAVSLAVQADKMAELETFAAKAKALLIDDIHLLGVNEQNQEALASFLGIFLKASKQVVITAAYPAKSLGALEEALSFKIALGHAVEVKLPNPNAQHEILSQLLASAGPEADETSQAVFIEALAKDFTEADAFLRRAQSLRGLKASLQQPSGLQELLPVIFAADPSAPESASDEELGKVLPSFAQPERPDAAGAALFYPMGQETHADWVWYRLRQVIGQQGWPFSLRLALRRGYDPEQVFEVPFLIANECQRAAPASILVLGPQPGMELAGKEKEFRYTLEHLLNPMGSRLGWIQHNYVKSSLPYVLAYLDMLQGVR